MKTEIRVLFSGTEQETERAVTGIAAALEAEGYRAEEDYNFLYAGSWVLIRLSTDRAAVRSALLRYVAETETGLIETRDAVVEAREEEDGEADRLRKKEDADRAEREARIAEVEDAFERETGAEYLTGNARTLRVSIEDVNRVTAVAPDGATAERPAVYVAEASALRIRPDAFPSRIEVLEDRDATASPVPAFPAPSRGGGTFYARRFVPSGSGFPAVVEYETADRAVRLCVGVAAGYAEQKKNARSTETEPGENAEDAARRLRALEEAEDS